MTLLEKRVIETRNFVQSEINNIIELYNMGLITEETYNNEMKIYNI